MSNFRVLHVGWVLDGGPLCETWLQTGEGLWLDRTPPGMPPIAPIALLEAVHGGCVLRVPCDFEGRIALSDDGPLRTLQELIESDGAARSNDVWDIALVGSGAKGRVNFGSGSVFFKWVDPPCARRGVTVHTTKPGGVAGEDTASSKQTSHADSVASRIGGGRDGSERQTEAKVRFLNVDVDVFGAFDRAPLLEAFGDDIDVLHDGEREPGVPVLSFELSTASPTLPGVISELVALVRALPDEARAAWNLANRRVLNVGIQAGLDPRCSEWTLSVEMMAALVEVNAYVTLTVYGAEVGGRTEPSRSGDAGGKGRRAWPRGRAHRRSRAMRRP